MKIGMNLLLYTTRPDASTFPIADRLQAMGYDGLEWPVFAIDAAGAAAIGKYNQSSKLGATTVFVLGGNQNPLSADAGDRAAALDALKQGIERTAACGANMMCGPFVQPLGHFTGVGPTADEHGRCVEFLRQGGEYAAKHGVTLVVEYLNRFEIYFLNTAADASKLCSEVNHPHVKTMVDSFHANIEEKNLRTAVLAARPHLAHIHISENDRGIPGSGQNVQWDDFFTGIKESGFDGWLMIEAFGQALPDLAAAAKIWRPLFNSNDEVATQGLAFIKRKLAG